MFASTSRYATLHASTYTTPDNRQIAYVARRFLPQLNSFTLLLLHTVTDSDRLDNITAQYLDDPQQFWRICDANDQMSPFDLTATPGETIDITLPQGYSRVSQCLRVSICRCSSDQWSRSPRPKRSTDAMISAQVNTGGQRSGFQLVFSMNKKSTIYKTLLPSGYFIPGITRVILACTLGGIPNVLIDGSGYAA